MSNHKNNRWDIFCKIVDNYGDIGVCWRLSQQLAHEHHLQVRLFIDDFATASKIISALDSPSTQTSQIVNGVEICAWPTGLIESEIDPADVVIETFGCTLPDEYIQQIQPYDIIWINLEYLSAEAWVSDFHAKPSQHPTLAITKYFFFPGFFDDTGGLIREENLRVARDAFLNSKALQKEFWQKLGLADPVPRNEIDTAKNSVKISFFCSPQADINSLFLALMKSHQPVILFLPFNGKIADLNEVLTDFKLTIGEVLHKGNLTVHLLPFLSQADYDRLLWACDLNFVRGEDSWIRAIWAGKPFIWQPYLQAEDVHINKLDAFLKAYASNASADVQSLLHASHLVWSGNSLKNSQPADEAGTQDEYAESNVWQSLINHLPTLQTYTNKQANALAMQPDLATKLVIFSENLRKNKV